MTINPFFEPNCVESAEETEELVDLCVCNKCNQEFELDSEKKAESCPLCGETFDFEDEDED